MRRTPSATFGGGACAPSIQCALQKAQGGGCVVVVLLLLLLAQQLELVVVLERECAGLLAQQLELVVVVLKRECAGLLAQQLELVIVLERGCAACGVVAPLVSRYINPAVYPWPDRLQAKETQDLTIHTTNGHADAEISFIPNTHYSESFVEH